MKKILKLLVSFGTVALLFATTLALAPPQSAYAVTTQDAACEAINGAAGCTKENSDITGVINLIVQVISIVIGAVAVIMIIMAGYKYITSGGDTGKVTAAKNALIYALIGLVIVGLAQLMVRVVIKNTDAATKKTSSSTSVNA